MNILWVTNSIYPYRSKVFDIMRIAHNLDLITLGTKYSQGGVAHSNFYKKTSYRFKIPFRTLFKVKKFDFIVISGWDSAGYIIVILLAMIFKIPHTLLFESNLDSSNHKRGIFAETRKWIFRHISTILTLSVLAYEAALVYSGNEKKIIESKNWFDSENFNFMESPEEIVGYRYIYIGRLIPQKGVERLIQAFRQTARENDELLIIGDGPEKIRLMESYRDSRVIFIGPIEHSKLATFLSQCNALVFPSYNDVYGFPCLEALSCGLGVVVSRNAGIWKDIYQIPGVVVFDDNLAEMLEKIREIKPHREIVDISDYDVRKVLISIQNAYLRSRELMQMRK